MNKILFTYKGTMPANTVINNIRADTVAIVDSAFFSRSSLASVTIPASVTSIKTYAFGRCNNLRTVVVSGRTTIDRYAFPDGVQITCSD